MLNRDVVVALLVLAFGGVMLVESFEIRRVAFSSLPAAAWPRLLLGALLVLGVVYLVQALRGRVRESELDHLLAESGEGGVERFSNPAFCFLAFFVFLLAMPVLGMMIGGVLFVFACLTWLGERSWRAAGIHALVSVGAVVSMWAVFTFALGVFLPEGRIVSFR